MKSLLFLILFWNLGAFGASKELYEEHVYDVDDGETFKSISEKFFKKRHQKRYKTLDSYQKELIKWNPHVLDWNKIGDGTKIYVTYPYAPNVDYPYAPVLPYKEID